jgi:hypothetical protein
MEPEFRLLWISVKEGTRKIQTDIAQQEALTTSLWITGIGAFIPF